MFPGKINLLFFFNKINIIFDYEKKIIFNLNKYLFFTNYDFKY